MAKTTKPVSDEKALEIQKAVDAMKGLAGKRRHDWPEFTEEMSDLLETLTLKQLRRMVDLLYGAKVSLAQ